MTNVANMSAFDGMTDGYALVAYPARSSWYFHSRSSCVCHGIDQPVKTHSEKRRLPNDRPLRFAAHGN